MNTPNKFKVFAVIITLSFLVASIPTIVAHSQMGGGYICGQFQRLDAGTRGFPAFVPYGYENDQGKWWVITTLNGNLPVISTGQEIDPIANYGVKMRIWNPDFDAYGLISIGSYKVVPTCEPTIEFMSDKYSVLSGACVRLWWNVDASGLDAVYLNDQYVNPTDQTTVCPNTTTTYTLQVSTSYAQYSPSITIYVEYPSSTPKPTSTPIPPTKTRVLPSKTLIPPTAIPPTVTPTPPPYDGALPGNGYEPSPNWLEQLFQIFAPPVEASYSPADCQARFTVGNCTWFVAGKRPDVCQWIKPGQGHAYQWSNQAQQNGGAFGISVNKKPIQVGDIVVWSPYCAGSLEYGHVALVTRISSNGEKIDIEEMNWSIGNGHRTIKVEDCMSFISSPAPVKTITPTPILTPNPVIVPTPSGQPSNLFQWIIDLFK